MSDPVHVVNGDSVGDTLPHTGLPGEVVVWKDVLHEGDVPPGDPAAVRLARAEFLAGSGYGAVERILADLTEADAALTGALDEGRETVLWFEHDLHDQLQLIQILARIADHPRRDVAQLITLNAFPGHPGFAGLGELSAAELATLWPTRAPIGAEAYDTATRAYSALQDSDTDALAALAKQPSAELPYLAAAVRRLLEERPWSGTLLGRSERQILQAAAAGAGTPGAIFLATTRMEEAPYSGDSWIYERIDELARREPPLLEVTPDGVVATDEGRSAIASSS